MKEVIKDRIEINKLDLSLIALVVNNPARGTEVVSFDGREILVETGAQTLWGGLVSLLPKNPNEYQLIYVQDGKPVLIKIS
jgi:hypothetical protein